jgi:hypothetical protein
MHGATWQAGLDQGVNVQEERRLPVSRGEPPEQVQRVSWKPVRYMATAAGSIRHRAKVVKRREGGSARYEASARFRFSMASSISAGLL